ncbi:putative X-linked retinitis pigmentosa GTPase regulator-like, partial [Apostichopus japonicus]
SGQLYLWGKNSHVIPDSKESLSHFHPSLVECHHPVSKLACGAWHAAAVTGYPQWQPLLEESSDEDLLESEGDDEEEEEEDGQLIDCMKSLALKVVVGFKRQVHLVGFFWPIGPIFTDRCDIVQ